MIDFIGLSGSGSSGGARSCLHVFGKARKQLLAAVRGEREEGRQIFGMMGDSQQLLAGLSQNVEARSSSSGAAAVAQTDKTIIGDYAGKTKRWVDARSITVV